MSIEQPIAKRAAVCPVVDLEFMESEFRHSERGTIIDPHTAKQKSKMRPEVTPQYLLLQETGGDRRREKRMGREDT